MTSWSGIVQNVLACAIFPLGDLVLSGVSILASPNFDILGVKFDSKLIFEDHVRGIVSRVSLRMGILRLDTSVSNLWTLLCQSVCVTSFLFCICYPNPWVMFSDVEVRCWMSPSASWALGVFGGQALSRSVSCRWVIDVVWLGLVCCTRLILTLITVCSATFHLLLLEFDIPSCGSDSSIAVCII